MIQELKHNKFKLLLLIVLLLVIQLAAILFQQQLEAGKVKQNYASYADDVYRLVEQEITRQQETTIGLAIVLSSTIDQLPQGDDFALRSAVFDKVKEQSNYQNLWLQIVDTNGRSRYRSWTETLGDELSKVRPEFAEIVKNGRPIQSVSSGKFDLSIKAIAPISYQGEVTGFLDVISHFNSIQKDLEMKGLDSLVVATQQRSELIKYPFSPNKIADFYVSNLNPNRKILQRMTPELLRQFVSHKYVVWENLFVVPYPLVANNGQLHGHLLVFDALEDVKAAEQTALSSDQQSALVKQGSLLVSLLLIVLFLLFITYSKKNYYRRILDAENNLVLVTDGKKYQDGNRKFNQFFPSLQTGEHECICDLFVKEEGYIQKFQNGKSWVEYLLDRPDGFHMAKIERNGKSVILSLKAQQFTASLAVVVISDITQLKELHNHSRTDALTRAGNRRSFDFQLKQNVEKAKKASSNLSLVLLDLDNFKHINDRFGYLVGDEVLQKITDIAFDVMKHKQVIFRVGGEEFAILLEKTALAKAESLAETIRREVERSQVDPRVTVSIGIAKLQEGEPHDSLFNRAEQALTFAKSTGKNQIKIDSQT